LQTKINRLVMKNIRATLMLGALITISCQQEARRRVSDQAILIYNANTIDVGSGDVVPNRAILIDSAAILEVGEYESLKALLPEEQQFDVGGRYVIPGLWDMHVHMEGEDLVADNRALMGVYLAYGITTVRDCASDLGEQVLAWRDSINSGLLMGPRIFTAGRKLEGINSIWKGDLEIASEAELQQMLNQLDGYKVDFVKITENTLPGDLFLTSVAEARKRGYKVTGHVPYDLTIQELAGAGFSGIEHASYVLRLGADEQSIVSRIRAGELDKAEAEKLYTSTFDQARAIEGYKMLAALGVAVTPTLIGGRQLAYLDETDHSNDDFLRYLSNRFTAKYQWRIDRMASETPEQRYARKDRYQLIAGQLRYLREAGVALLAGSDAAALNTYVYPALSLHEELVLFQEAGLKPLHILQSATINGARFMEVEDETASIKSGKAADLVILNGNPLDDIKATQNIFAVVRNGVYLNRTTLDQMLDRASSTKQQLDLARQE